MGCTLAAANPLLAVTIGPLRSAITEISKHYYLHISGGRFYKTPCRPNKSSHCQQCFATYHTTLAGRPIRVAQTRPVINNRCRHHRGTMVHMYEHPRGATAMLGGTRVTRSHATSDAQHMNCDCRLLPAFRLQKDSKILLMLRSSISFKHTSTPRASCNSPDQRKCSSPGTCSARAQSPLPS